MTIMDFPRENISNSPIGDDDNMSSNMTDIEKRAVTALVSLCDNYHSIDDDDDDHSIGDDDDQIDYDDDGNTGYFEMRVNDTLAGWTYSRHPNSICLTPPSAWRYTPYAINVQWYKRPLFYSDVHKGYFMSNTPLFVNKVEELGAVYNQDRIWE